MPRVVRLVFRSLRIALFNDRDGIFALVALITGFMSFHVFLSGPRDFTIPVFVATAIIFLQAWIKSCVWLRRYADLEGEYQCYSYKSSKDEAAGNLRDIEPNRSHARIVYISSRVLRITITEAFGNIWTGDAQMESSEMGNVAWHYTKLVGKDKPWRSNGAKRVTVIRAGKSEPLRIGLLEYQNRGFTDELLEKV